PLSATPLILLALKAVPGRCDPVPVPLSPTMKPGIGRCSLLFIIAIIFDVAGLILLLVGVFASLTAWDFYIYTGAVIIALSLVFWMLWYTGNVEVSNKELGLTLRMTGIKWLCEGKKGGCHYIGGVWNSHDQWGFI
uniref:Transmembrane protein 238 like n=1 Tax=Xenopus tropicalis TaxID=8364 RepID=A0A803JDJ2_XENTR